MLIVEVSAILSCKLWIVCSLEEGTKGMACISKNVKSRFPLLEYFSLAVPSALLPAVVSAVDWLDAHLGARGAHDVGRCVARLPCHFRDGGGLPLTSKCCIMQSIFVNSFFGHFWAEKFAEAVLPGEVVLCQRPVNG